MTPKRESFPPMLSIISLTWSTVFAELMRRVRAGQKYSLINSTILIIVLISSWTHHAKASPVPSFHSSHSATRNSIGTSEQDITLYSDTNFKGFKTVVKLSNSCINLSGSHNDAASSLDANGSCVIVCEHAMCRGRCHQIHYYSSDLSRVGLNDMVSSIQPCVH